MERVLSVLLEVAAYSAIIIGCILLFRLLLRKHISPKLQYLLWLILILRLLLPMTFESGFHLESLRAKPAAQAQASYATPETAFAPVAAAGEAAPQQAARPSANAAAAKLSDASPAKAPVDWTKAAFFLWLGGAALTLAFTQYARLSFVKKLRRSVVQSGPEAQLLFAGCKEALGVRQDVRLLTTTLPISPALTLLRGRSVLLLPERLCESRALRYAMLHELTHYRRRDHWMLELLCVLRAVYWFHPVLWFAFSELRADMETACDAGVIALLEPAEKKNYLTTLLRLFTSDFQPALGMAQAGTRRMARKRLKGAFMRHTTSKPALAAAIVLTLLLVLGCFTTACQTAPTARAEMEAANSDPVIAIDAGTGEDAFSVTAKNGHAVSMTYRDGGAAEGSFLNGPREEGNVISVREAAYAAAQRLVRVFDEAVQDGELYVYFMNYEDLSLELYEFYYGGKGYETADSYGFLDASTGSVLKVEELASWREPAQADEAPDSAETSWEEAGEKTLEAAKAFVRERFSDIGTIQADSYFDGVQGTFRADEPICVDNYIHMDKGESYMLRIFYPSLRIGHFETFPMGWEYCQHETWYYEYMHPEDYRSEYGALTEPELQTIADCAASRVGETYAGADGAKGWQYSQQFVSAIWAQYGAQGRVLRRAVIERASGISSYPAGTQITLIRGGGDERCEAFYLGGGRYVYANEATGTVAEGDFNADFGKAFTACEAASAAYVPRAGKYAVVIPTQGANPAPTPMPIRGDQELTEGDYFVLAETAQSFVGRTITDEFELLDESTDLNTHRFIEYLYDLTHVGVGGEGRADIHSAGDPALIAGRMMNFLGPENRYRTGICVGGGNYVMLDPNTRVVGLYSIADALASGEYERVTVSELYAPSYY